MIDATEASTAATLSGVPAFRSATSWLSSDTAAVVTVDVAAQSVSVGGRTYTASIRESARDALLNGRWDPIGELLEGLPAAGAQAAKLPYMTA